MIIYARDAADDIDSINRYIRGELKNPSAAQTILEDIFRTIDRLNDSPYLGSSLPQYLCFGNRDLRKIPVRHHYLIVYEVSDKVIIIQRVFYGRRDWMNILLDSYQNL